LMTGLGNRNVLLLAALIAAAAGVLLFRSHTDTPAPQPQSADAHASVASPHFATLHSSRHVSAGPSQAQQQEQLWKDALNASDRCSAMSTNIINSDEAQTAMQWARSIEDETMRKMAMEAIFCAWARFDASAAANWAVKNDDDASGRAFALTSAFENWAAQDATSASAAVSKLEQTDQTYGIAAVAPALTAQNPNEAIHWAENFDENDSRNLATHAVVTAWARNAPADAAAWVATQPDSFDRADDVRAVIQKWMETDANAAVEWAKNLPAGIGRDGALDFIASQWMDGDPSVAALWGESIDRAELRDARLQAVAGKWLSTDPTAARNWLDHAPLSDQAKAELVTAPSGALQ
jgi:hypothetical protein